MSTPTPAYTAPPQNRHERRKTAALERRKEPLGVIDPNRRYSIPVSLELLDISRKRFYDHVGADPPRIKIVKDGRRSFVTGEELIRVSRTSMP